MFLGNLALSKPAFQSSFMSKHSAKHAVDGRVDGECSRTTFENDPWWRVDLQREKYIMAVTITNCCEETVENVDIRVGNNFRSDKIPNKICGHIPELYNKQSITVLCPSDVSGRFINIKAPGVNRSLAICEVKVYETLGKFLS